ncbi:MAG TPA: heparan-alpha-glucosaminide N-acetyltransferase domain-containing protein [Verrucomicrobiae bacterium]|jgi:uncharacterized membrane protein|nr:heparan-alpha-glucosaminide N-acetyltransferase domain-containing protein [Verrucomicrobiae bacterium]
MPSRDKTVDILRGIAMAVMVEANMAGPLLNEPHPSGLRLLGTLAAPLFVFLAGMSVQITASRYSLSHYLRRGLELIAAGALIDLAIWKILPFTSYDVLYLIGLSLPLVFLAGKLKPSWRGALIVGIFFAGTALRKFWGYSPEALEVLLGKGAAFPPARAVLKSGLADGWFPVFPWMGFALLGFQMGEWCESTRSFSRAVPHLIRLSLAAGAAAVYFYPSPALTREGYSELFYPPTLGFCLLSAGGLLLLYRLIKKIEGLAPCEPLALFGKNSFFVYVLHLVVIEYALVPFFGREPLPVFLGLYAGMMGLLAIAAVLKAKVQASSWGKASP